jgi:two-component system, LytTR family, response regulator LytT
MTRALIVDDEAPARSELRFMLEQIPGVEVVGEASSAREALELMRALDYDVVFIDIEMPQTSGIEVAQALKELPSPPQVVFVTAYSEHAVRAFEVEATDYLVKPLSDERLRAAVAKVRREEAPREDAGQVVPPRVSRLPVEKLGKKLLVPIEDIVFITSKDDYSFVHTNDQRYLSSMSLGTLEKRLAGDVFFRVHRGYVVNLHKVLEIVPMYGGTYVLVVNDAQQSRVPVSRRRAAGLKDVLGL